jgi:hypothetical protein
MAGLSTPKLSHGERVGGGSHSVIARFGSGQAAARLSVAGVRPTAARLHPVRQVCSTTCTRRLAAALNHPSTWSSPCSSFTLWIARRRAAPRVSLRRHTDPPRLSEMGHRRHRRYTARGSIPPDHPKISGDRHRGLKIAVSPVRSWPSPLAEVVRRRRDRVDLPDVDRQGGGRSAPSCTTSCGWSW